jgi:hypothetical protein
MPRVCMELPPDFVRKNAWGGADQKVGAAVAEAEKKGPTAIRPWTTRKEFAHIHSKSQKRKALSLGCRSALCRSLP